MKLTYMNCHFTICLLYSPCKNSTELPRVISEPWGWWHSKYCALITSVIQVFSRILEPLSSFHDLSESHEVLENPYCFNSHYGKTVYETRQEIYVAATFFYHSLNVFIIHLIIFFVKSFHLFIPPCSYWKAHFLCQCTPLLFT